MGDYWLWNELMRRPTSLLFVTVLLYGLAAAPARAEQVTYYVWTDDQGLPHFEDTPPANHAYETRTIEVPDSTGTAPPGASGANTESPSPGTEEGGGNASSSAATQSAPTTDAQRPIADEEQRRLEQEPGFNAGGAATAPSADTASPGSTATGAGPASGSAEAQGAATAPGATIPPPVVGP